MSNRERRDGGELVPLMVHLASGQSIQTEIEAEADAESDEIVLSLCVKLNTAGGFTTIGSLTVHSKAVSAIALL
jgi:hypothetical protein